MKAKEIRELNTAEIVERIATEKEQLDKMVLNHTISPLENPSKIKESRRNIARMLTIVRQRELNGNNN